MLNIKGCVFNIQRFCLHDGPGIRTTVFLKGCNLKCPWCSNPESQNINPEEMYDPSKKMNIIVGEYLDTSEIMTEILKDSKFYKSSNGGVTLSGGEIFCQYELTYELIRLCKGHDINVAIESSCFAEHSRFKKIHDNVDYILVDLKHYDDVKHIKYTGVSLKPIINNIITIKKEKLILRIPIIPGVNDSLEDAEKYALLLHQLDIQNVTLLPFHQYGKSKYTFLNRDYSFADIKPIDKSDLICYKDIFTIGSINCQL
ncbi:glycyl-radical enzyme activating protein [Brenneria tiliae]|uniref:glycyl-radical enzyme activating protein n=1 Tax=Brenneria tiliae TaxID=2914984 RepID=UPI002014C0CA|nr:glycyl-radical enzyme activating protein [Brenneria tiliae]MCL2895874.1 glycyl-radical enzyme activating protein [Brenneria tiliae]MCL2900414.1 glycyl-radical enzyme activating protein [Brenneria tiliae]